MSGKVIYGSGPSKEEREREGAWSRARSRVGQGQVFLGSPWVCGEHAPDHSPSGQTSCAIEPDAEHNRSWLGGTGAGQD